MTADEATALVCFEAFRLALNAFIDTPSADNLRALVDARNACRDAHDACFRRALERVRLMREVRT